MAQPCFFATCMQAGQVGAHAGYTTLAVGGEVVVAMGVVGAVMGAVGAATVVWDAAAAGWAWEVGAGLAVREVRAVGAAVAAMRSPLPM